jgi:hypothetical protein
MDKVKLIIDNAARRAVMTATPVAPGMAIAATLNSTMSNVCRATGTALDITMTWPSTERIGGVHLIGNLTPTATIEVLGYSDAAGTTLVRQVGPILACPAPARKLRFPWTAATAAVAYAYGGGSHGFAWFDNTNVRRLIVKIRDTASLQGYIEISRQFVGESFSPDENAAYNPGLTPVHLGSQYRTHAGDRRSIKGTKHFKLAIELEHMTESDRNYIWNMMVANGLDEPMIVSLYPGDASPSRERDHMMLGALVQTSAMRRPNFAQHATSLEWESM